MDLSSQKKYEEFSYSVCDYLQKNHVNYIIHTAKEAEYDYLYDDPYCCYIEIVNPYRQDSQYGIEIGSGITLFYNNSHQHVDICEDNGIDQVVADVLKTFEDVMENRIAGYILLCGDRWLYGGSANLERLAADMKDPLTSADEYLTEPEFQIKLRALGGKHAYTFWNPAYDREIEIPRREYTYFCYHISKDGRCPRDRFVIVDDAEIGNVVLLNSGKKRGEKYLPKTMTISRKAVSSIVQIIREKQSVMDCDDECLWKGRDEYSFDSNEVYNSIYFGDGKRENTIGEFGLWDFYEDADGPLAAAFDAYYKISDILTEEGVPEEYFAEDLEDPLFEGYEISDYRRLNPKNKNLSTLGDLHSVLTHCWKAETAYPLDQQDWSEDLPSYGQCAVTAMLVFDLFGGELYRTKDHSHYYNRIDGHWVDLTAQQFWAYGDSCDYAAGEMIERQNLGQSGHTKKRYEILVKNVKDYLDSLIPYPPENVSGPAGFCGGNWIDDLIGDTK